MKSDSIVCRFNSQQLHALNASLNGSDSVSISSPTASSTAYLAWCLFQAEPGTWLWVTDNPTGMEKLCGDLNTLAAPDKEKAIIPFPAWDIVPGEGPLHRMDIVGERLNAIHALMESTAPRIIVACIQSLMQRTIAADALRAQSLTLKLTESHDPTRLAESLTGWGYEFTYQVETQGQASLRGGLLDIWPPTEPDPIRIEFFGDVIDSIRSFDHISQSSIVKQSLIVLTPVSEASKIHQASLMDYLPDGTHCSWVNTDSILDHVTLYEETIQGIDHDSFHFPFAHLLHAIGGLKGRKVFTGSIPSPIPPYSPTLFEAGLGASESLPHLETDLFHPDIMERSRARFIEQLVARAQAGGQIHLFFDTPGAGERFMEVYGAASSAVSDHFHLHVAPLSEGFSVADERLLAVTEQDIYGYEKKRRSAARSKRLPPSALPQTALTSWSELVPGELVIHADHGLGKYLGLYEMQFNGQLQEVLAIEYANEAKLYVPVTQTHLISRYVSVGTSHPELHTLGGKRWQHQKEAAGKAVEDLAALLLENQAARETLNGYAYTIDTPWQHEFEQSFPFEETEDQLRAIREIKEDMESARPMDRLICGDVGFGKTEVAMRAAFKAVMDGKQVAVLVPTTILAQQHYFTFSERMASFPITIEMLSRFRTRAEQRETIERLKKKQVDIVIGTHRLVQPDVGFADLGLVIIDEEQRFGVEHKERLKRFRQLVDVLTMTATPIPRTLYMSLTGAKDMSTIQTAPRERLAIETIVTEDNDHTIRQAIMNEINRNGQVFFLHNRVQSIKEMHDRLKKIVPEAWISVAHGQMTENKLSAVMRKFTEQRFNVLLCTTIIESGVDIPNVNTIIIDRADRFGLAELYQLRGRVGRYKHKAYAYLLLPRHKRLFDVARRRIGAIKRYGSLGAGFKVALRDLEIRGAGNLLGAQQSGHIAAIGFDLYCQLLRRAVSARKGESLPPVRQVEVSLDFVDWSPRQLDSGRSVALPYDYMEEENQRIDFYRRLAEAVTESDVKQLRNRLRDQFGPVPEPAHRMLLLAQVRIACAGRGIERVEVRDDKVILTRNRDYVMINHRFPRLQAAKTTERLNELLTLISQC